MDSEKSMAPHSSTLAWKIPWTEEPGSPSPTPGVCSNSCPSSQWCHQAISSSVVPFSSCPQSLPVSRSFPISQLFTWGGQNIGVSASASVLPMNTQDRSPLGWTGWLSLQSKGLSRVFSNTTVQKHQFFIAQVDTYYYYYYYYYYFVCAGELLWHMGSSLQCHGLSCLTACGILVS